MTVHLISGRDNSAVLRYFNSDVGSWVDFPVNKPNSQSALSIAGSSMSDIWVGGVDLVSHWDGTSWTDYPITDGYTGMWCNVGVSPDGSGVFVGTRRDASNYGDLYRFEGSGFVWKQEIPYYGATYGMPAPVSYDESYLVASSSPGSLPDMYRWTSGGGIVQEASGVGLPNFREMMGIVRRSSDGMIFLLDRTGVTYRGTFGGPWTIDNSTDGPFSLIVSGSSWNSLCISKDGYVGAACGSSPNNLWVRRGNDDWVAINLTGTVRGEPAIAGEIVGPDNVPRYLVAGDSAGQAHYSDDGGVTGQDVPPADGNDQTGTWAYSLDFLAIVEIDEGEGSVQAFDGESFIFPYNNSSTITYDSSDGYEGYDFVIRKGEDLNIGRITIDVALDGYADEAYDLYPAAGAIDIQPTTEIRFRIRKE